MTMSIATVAFLASLVLPAAAPTLLFAGTWEATIDLDTEAASPGDTVTFTGTSEPGVDAGPCLVQSQGVDLEAPCTFDFAGGIEGSFVVPAATPGTLIVSFCYPGCFDGLSDPDGQPDYWQTNVDLSITDLVVDEVVVPDLKCESLADAREELEAEGLTGEVIQGREEGAVRHQRPGPNEDAVGTVVHLYMEPVYVPNVEGATYSEAEEQLGQSCLTIAVSGDSQAGSVVSQSPAAGTSVNGMDPVTVTLTGANPGGASDPGSARGADAPGRDGGLVSSMVDEPRWLIVVLLTAASVLAGTAWRATRSSRDRAWVAKHVTITTGPAAPGTAFITDNIDPAHADLIIQVRSVDRGRLVKLEETQT